MKKQSISKEPVELSINFWTMPTAYTQAMSLKDYKAAVMKHEGWIFAQGYTYDIVGKKIAPGIYRVSLKARH